MTRSLGTSYRQVQHPTLAEQNQEEEKHHSEVYAYMVTVSFLLRMEERNRLSSQEGE